jgi:hypothetical protein
VYQLSRGTYCLPIHGKQTNKQINKKKKNKKKKKRGLSSSKIWLPPATDIRVSYPIMAPTHNRLHGVTPHDSTPPTPNFILSYTMMAFTYTKLHLVILL